MAPSLRARTALPFALTLTLACSSDPQVAADASADVTDAADDLVDAAPPRVRVIPTEWPRTPPAFPTYSHGMCPTLRGGADVASTLNEGFESGTARRRFRLVVPRNYDPTGTDRWPVIFAWHWLAGSSEQMLSEGDILASAERYRMIVVVPDQLTVNGRNVNGFVWPFVDPTEAEPELVFFDDLLACVSSAYRVDPARVHGLGVSAGALWLTYLSTTDRARYMASVAILSGGLGSLLDAWRMDYVARPNKYPALVLWGGPTDRLGVDFNVASQRLRDALIDDGHFVLTCTHDRGHALPPFMPPPGETRFSFLWDFFAQHPYGLAPATSPYIARGLPGNSPSWCSIPSEFLTDARDR
jgi:hypothetical protein